MTSIPRLRRLRALVLCLLCGLATLAWPAPARTTLTVVADDNYPPYVFKQADGRVDGYVVDLWRLWERKTGVRVEFVASDWDTAKRTMAEGRADVIDTIFRTAEREKTLDFLAPYAELPVPVYVHRDIGGITDVASLHGFLVAAKAGDACIDRLRAAGVSNMVAYPSYEQIVAAAVAAELRIFCIDEPPANYLLYRAGASRDFRKAFVLYQGQFHRAVRRGDAATLALVQRGFDAISKDEQQALHDKWMARELDLPAWVPYLAYGFAAALAAGGGVLLWGIALRRMVRRRTTELVDERQRLRTLIDALPDPVWLKDAAGFYLACNRAFERLFGTPEAQIVGRSDAEFVSSAQAFANRERDRAAQGAEQPLVDEGWLDIREDGSRGLFETLRTPMRDAAGRIVGVLGIAREVTHYRQSQERLQRLNRLYRVLTGINETIAATRDRQRLFDEVCRVVVEVGALTMAWIGKPDVSANRIRPVAHYGMAADYLEQIHVSLADDEHGRGPTGVAFREGRTDRSQDFGGESRMAPWREAARRLDIRSSAAFAIKVRGETRAVLSVYADKVDAFDTEEIELLERLAGQVGVAMEADEAETAHLQAVDALRQSEARFATLFRTSPVGMALGRLSDLSFVDLNQAWLDLFGYTRDAVIGHDGAELAFWCDEQARACVVARLRAGETVENFDTTFRTREGRVVDVSFAATPVQIAGEQYHLASFFDVSLRKQAARTLAEQAQALEALVAQRTAELNSIFEALPDLFFRLRSDGTILDYRAGRAGDLVLPPEQFLGRRVQDVLPPDVGAQIGAAIARVCADTHKEVVEYSLTTPGGAEAFEARLLPGRDGELIAVVRNITERKTMDAAREAAREESERLARVRSQFLANMSHEIRTPLNGILGLAQIGLADPRSVAAHGTFKRILESGRLLLGIVNDVLDLSKIEADRLAVESVPVEPGQLVASAVETVRESAHAKGLALSVTRGAGLNSRCLCDPLRLEQVTLNLLSNAIKFTAHGQVSVLVDHAGDELLLRVEDSGIGMTPDQLGQLFTAFQQADASTTRRYGGTGLGLIISRRLARLMGGELQVQSAAGRGSVFELRLPWREAPAEAPVAAAGPAVQVDSPAAGEALAGRRILVAEDNAVNQLVIESALAMHGASVVLVPDGQQAVDRIAEEGAQAFDVVLMDVQMPVMDGYEATRRIRALAPDLPVIGQTAHAMTEELGHCLAAGMVAHVAKPIDIAELVAAVARFARTPQPSAPAPN